jgi:thiamine biosynthesis lipoprotein
VATSGTYRRGIADIVDGRTGQAPKGVLRSTVVAENALDADALATSVYVLGAEEGIKLIDGIGGAGALVLTRDGKSIESNRWESLTNSEEEPCRSHVSAL